MVSTHISLMNGKSFDVEGELLEVARQLQAEGANPRLVSFTATISGKKFHVLVNAAGLPSSLTRPAKTFGLLKASSDACRVELPDDPSRP